MDIKDSVILISGAATRVGRRVALFLAKKGASISFSYYNDNEPWQDTLKELKVCGSDAMAVQTEVRSALSIKGLVEATMGHFGRISVLINNASVWLKSPFMEISEEDWDTALDINLKGPFLAAQAVVPYMQAQKEGLIINISDLSAFQVWPGYAHHAASKAGLISLTKSMALELAPHIRVNAIAPGTVLLPDNAPPEKRQWAEEKSVLKRVGTPEDVARLTEFIMECDFATGAVYFVDGGRAIV